jgi:hypothetical protein
MDINILAGMSHEEASKAALRELQGMTKTQTERMIERHTVQGAA